MDIIVIFNGLGNQMSQYAFFQEKKKNNHLTNFILNCKTHNGLDLNRAFNLNLKQNFFQYYYYVIFRLITVKKSNPISKPIKWFFSKVNCNVISENFDYRFNKDFLSESKGLTFYIGGWHSENYFKSIQNALPQIYKFNELKEPENLLTIAKIQSTNSISVHVRRGDYLNSENYKIFGNICTKYYFQKAVNEIIAKVDNPHFFIFSNDNEWVKENLSLKYATYVTCNKEENSWKDMFLMSKCKHNIIANSTFSWWAAWLNKNPEKIVISPDRFLSSDTQNHIYPENWIKISSD